MKKIIEGKIYNTEIAEMIADWDIGLSSSDFNNCSEKLYRTKNGAWFIAGSGGAMSSYSRSCGNNSWSGGSDIISLTSDEAIEWLEEHDEIDALETYFKNELTEA